MKKIEKYFKSDGNRQAEKYFKRLSKAVEDENPLAIAILEYQVIKDSSDFCEYKKTNDREKMVEIMDKVILSMVDILIDRDWEREKIEEFLEYISDFVREI